MVTLSIGGLQPRRDGLSAWSGSDGHAAIAYGPTSLKPPRKPTWEVRQRCCRVINDPDKLHRLNGVSGAPTLRIESGVYLKMMKMMNLRSLDPAYTAQGKVGMQSGGALEKVVWADYEGRRADLEADAKVIRQAVTDANETALAKLPPTEPYEGEEGGVIMRLHNRYERDPKLVSEKRKAAAATGDLACEVCGFDFKATYGDLGEGYIEVHHTKPVHTLLAGTMTKLDDLALLCANCHRMAHRKRHPLSIEAVRLALL